MGDNPLTPEQVCFAAKNHKLIFRFLSRQQLPKEEYYDIAVFGYPKAVRDYYSKAELQQYAFSTICWKYMSREIYNYHKSLQRQLRLSNVICTLAGQELSIQCLTPYGYQEMAKMEERLLLYELSTHLLEQTFRIVKLYCAGHTIREIAKSNKISIFGCGSLPETGIIICIAGTISSKADGCPSFFDRQPFFYIMLLFSFVGCSFLSTNPYPFL